MKHFPKVTSRLTRAAAGVTIVVATLGLSMLGAGEAAAAPTGTAMVQTQRMSDAALKSTQTGWYGKGSRLTLVCYKRGQAVSGYYSKYFANGRDDLWYQVSDGGFVADVDISTGTNNPITGPCGGGGSSSPQSSRESRAIAWATSQVGSRSYNFACQKFVENAFGTSGRFGSAIAMFNTLRSQGAIRGGTPPAGALTFSKSSYDQGYGHVSISLGNGRYVSGGMPAPSTVNYMNAPAAGGGTYLGWAYAPGSWPGR